MQELDELLEMTVQLAQVSLANENLPWVSILESGSDLHSLAQVDSTTTHAGGFASLLGKGHSNDGTLMLSQTDSQEETCPLKPEAMQMIMLAQCAAEAQGYCKAADDLQALIDAQKAKINLMKQRRAKTTIRKLPTTHEEAMAVIRNETISQSTKDCLKCINEAKDASKDKKLGDCASLCGFGIK